MSWGLAALRDSSALPGTGGVPHLHAGRCQHRRQARKRCRTCRGRASHRTCPHHCWQLCRNASNPPPGCRRRARGRPAATWTLTQAVQLSAPARRPRHLRRARAGAPERRPGCPRGVQSPALPRAQFQLRARLLGAAQRCCAWWAPARLHRPGAPGACAYTLPLPGGWACRTCRGVQHTSLRNPA